MDVPSVKEALFKTKQDLQDKLLLGGGTSEGTPDKNPANLKRIISQKAFQFGAESGVSAEFILSQAAEQMARSTHDISNMIATTQHCLSPQIHQGT